jgi:thymidylate synthase ThyX
MDRIKVNLLNITGLEAAHLAVQKPYGKKVKDPKKLLHKVAKIMKHESVLEHIIFQFDVTGTSRLELQEHMRHRHACFSGDNFLWFDAPSGKLNNRAKRYNVKISDLYEKWHFGAKPIKHRFSGKDQRMPLKAKLQKQWLRMCNEETGEISHCHVKDIVYTGIRDVYEIETETGKKIKITENHLMMTDKGWFQMCEAVGLLHQKNIVSWDKESLLATNGVPSHDSKEFLSAKRAEGLSFKEILALVDCSRITLSKRLNKFGLGWTNEERMEIATKNLEKGRMKVPWNKGKTYKHSKPQRVTEKRKIAWKKKRGANSNFFNDKKQFQAEHIGKIFNKKTTKLARQYERIKNIRYVGKEKVYDLEVTWPNDSKDKFSNFICNGFIVHNSPTVESTRYALKDFYEEITNLALKEESAVFEFVKRYTVFSEKMMANPEGSLTQMRIKQRFFQLQSFAEVLNLLVPDEAKYELLECFRTSFVWTINARSMLNFLKLRTSKNAHFEIRHIANLMKDLLCENEEIKRLLNE